MQKALLITILFGIVLVAGCVSSEGTYKCSNGSQVSDKTMCFDWQLKKENFQFIDYTPINKDCLNPDLYESTLLNFKTVGIKIDNDFYAFLQCKVYSGQEEIHPVGGSEPSTTENHELRSIDVLLKQNTDMNLVICCHYGNLDLNTNEVCMDSVKISARC